MEETAKSSLGNLPSELLILIAEHTGSDRAINSLARTNHFLHALLNPYLYLHNAQLKRRRRSALLWAAEHGHVKTARLALKPFHSLRRTQPLLVAAQNGHSEIVALLIAAMGGANMDIRDKIGYSALDKALMAGHGEVVKQLVNAGASIQAPGQVLRRRYWQAITAPICKAVQEGLLSPIRALIETGSMELDKKIWCGYTILCYACLFDRVEIAQYLLEAGANPEITGSLNMTPLKVATRGCHADMVKLLLTYGANPNKIEDRPSRQTPIYHAVQARLLALMPSDYEKQSQCLFIIQMLIGTDKIDLNQKDRWDKTPLTYIIWHDMPGLHSSLFSEYHTNPNFESDFDFGITKARVDLVKALLETSRMTFNTIVDGLVAAIEKNSSETNPIIELILESGFDIESHRSQLLQFAYDANNLTAAKLLE